MGRATKAERPIEVGGRIQVGVALGGPSATIMLIVSAVLLAGLASIVARELLTRESRDD